MRGRERDLPCASARRSGHRQAVLAHMPGDPAVPMSRRRGHPSRDGDHRPPASNHNAAPAGTHDAAALAGGSPPWPRLTRERPNFRGRGGDFISSG